MLTMAKMRASTWKRCIPHTHTHVPRCLRYFCYHKILLYLVLWLKKVLVEIVTQCAAANGSAQGEKREKNNDDKIFKIVLKQSSVGINEA